MASQAVQGVISSTSSRSFPDRQNPNNQVTLYSFQLEGSNRWFRTGENPLPFAKGQQVQFVADGQNVDVRTMQTVVNTVQPAPAPTTPPRSRGGYSRSPSEKAGPASKDEYWANKEARDLEKEARFQAVNEPRMAMSVAVEAASRVVVAALQTDALGFGNTAKAKRLPMIADYVEELATRLALFITNAPETLEAAKEDASAGGDWSYDGEGDESNDE